MKINIHALENSPGSVNESVHQAAPLKLKNPLKSPPAIFKSPPSTRNAQREDPDNSKLFESIKLNEKRIAELEAEVALKNSENKHLRENFKRLEIDLEQMTDQAKTYETNYNAMVEKNPEQISRQHQDLVRKYDEETDRHAELKQRFSELEENYNNIERNAREHNEIVMNLRMENNKLSETVAQLRDESDTNRKNYETMASKNQSEISKMNQELMIKYDAVTDELEEEKKKNIELKALVEKLRNLQDLSSKQLKEVEEEKSRMLMGFSELQKNKTSLEAENHDLRRQSQKYTKTGKTLETLISSKTKDLEGLNKEKSDAEELNRNLKLRVEEMENKLGELQTQNKNKDETIAQLRDESETYKNSYQALSSNNRNKIDAEHKTLMEKYDRVTDEYEKLKIEFNNQKNELIKLSNAKRELAEIKREEGEKYRKYEKETKDLKDKLELALKELNSLKDEKSRVMKESMSSKALQEKMEKLEKEREELLRSKQDREKVFGKKNEELERENNLLIHKLKEFDKVSKERDEFQAKFSILEKQLEAQINQAHTGPPILKINDQEERHFPASASKKVLKLDQSQETYNEGFREHKLMAMRPFIEKDSDFMRTSYNIDQSGENYDNYHEFEDEEVPRAEMRRRPLGNIREIDPLQADLLYPYNEPSEYYYSKENKTHRGKLVKFKADLFKNVIDSLMREPEDNMLRFKISCLREKSMLYKSDIVEIGAITSIREERRQLILHIHLQVTNKCSVTLSNVDMEYKGDNQTTTLIEQKRLGPIDSVDPQEKFVKEYIFDFAQIPYKILSVDLNIRTPRKRIQFNMPCGLTKYFENKRTNVKDFRTRWRSNVSNIFCSQPVYLHPRVISAYTDFKKYFPFLIDPKPYKEQNYVTGTDAYTLSGVLEFVCKGWDYLIKIIVEPDMKAIFKVICDNDNGRKYSDVEVYLLNTLMFLFGK